MSAATLPYTYLEDISALATEIPKDSIVSRTLYKDDGVKVVLFGFDAGQELSEHTSSRPAILHILRGEAQLGLGDEKMDAREGGWTFMQPNLKHSLMAKTPVLMLLTLLQA